MYENEQKLMTRIAVLFYEKGYTQEEIGELLHMSRLQVHRRLRTAVEEGHIKIQVQSRYRDNILMEEQLHRLFPTQEIIVTESDPDTEKNKRYIARAGAELLIERLENCSYLGVSWGSTASLVSECLPKHSFKGLKVGNIVGGVSDLGDAGAQQVAMKIAMKLDAELRVWSLPVMMETAETRNMVLRDHYIKKDIEALRACDACLLGIGNKGSEFSHMVQQNFDSVGKVPLKSSAVGEIAGRYFDIDGNLAEENTKADRRVGLTLEDFKNMKCSIGVAGGAEKRDAIIGALKGGYLTCLVTDIETAQNIVQYETSRHKKAERPDLPAVNR